MARKIKNRDKNRNKNRGHNLSVVELKLRNMVNHLTKEKDALDNEASMVLEEFSNMFKQYDDKLEELEERVRVLEGKSV